jgi:hypothetical protein
MAAMKCREFGAALRAFAGVLDVAGAPAARDRIVMFAAVFDAHPTWSVSDLAKRIAALCVTGPAGSPSLGDVAPLLSALKSFLNKTAKTAMPNDVTAIEELLRDRASMELGAFVRMATAAAPTAGCGRRGDAPRTRDDLVAHYKQKLEAALGDEETFTAIYNDLRANMDMGKPELTALAKQMTGSGARTQDAALRKIWNRHQSLVVFKAKSRATAGRSAA